MTRVEQEAVLAAAKAWVLVPSPECICEGSPEGRNLADAAVALLDAEAEAGIGLVESEA